MIQDSDEDEPLIEDDIPTSTNPQQHPDPPAQQRHDPNAEPQIDYPMEHMTTQSSSTEPQLNVNFDVFLQSQGSQAAMTLSQQRREERWIPSTGEGGGGSIGASDQATYPRRRCIHTDKPRHRGNDDGNWIGAATTPGR